MTTVRPRVRRLRQSLLPLRSVASRWFATASYGRKWLVLGIMIGVVAGLGAVVFYDALTFCTHLFLGVLGGYRPPTPAGEGNFLGTTHFTRPWAIPLVAGFGALLAGILVFSVAPEAEGHGTDAAISAVHHDPRGIRLRTVVVKIVASALTIGSGGSGGREGPTGQISAGFGSLFARLFDLSPADARIAVASGIGSGIGSIFGAPLGGSVLATEIMYRDDFEVEALLPAFIASTVGYVVFGAFEGYQPLFGYVGNYRVTGAAQLGWFAVIGILSGLVGLGYAQGFYAMVAWFSRLRAPRWIRPAMGGVVVGLIALAIPEVMGTGYGWIQQSMSQHLLQIPLWIVVALPFARILATGLSIGSGGSGGIFGPGMVIGAFLGAAVWRLFEPFAPGLGHDPAPYVIVAMMACFGSISRAPLAVMLMVAEMTGTLTLIVPAMVAVGLATLIVTRTDDTIYRSQLRNRAESPAHRILAGLPLLSVTSVQHAMARPRVVAASRDTVATVSQSLDDSRVAGAPVTDDEGRYVGVVTRANLDSYAPETVIAEVPVTSVPPLRDQSHLDQALDTLITSATSWLPVIDEDRRLVGTLSISDLVRGYRIALQSTMRRMTIVTSDGQREVVVAPGSPLDGEPIRGDVPHGVLITSIERGPDIIQPTGDTIIHAGDRLSSLGSAASLDLLQAAASTSADGAAPHAGP
jgi:H+/Cl- antiporter ClcA